MGQNAAITASGFPRDILKHRGKHLPAVSLVDARILLHKRECLEWLQLQTARTHRKGLLASFPIPSLNFYQPRGKLKAINTVCSIIWVFSFGAVPGLFGKCNSIREENTALSSYYSRNTSEFAYKGDSWSSLQLTLANLLGRTARTERTKDPPSGSHVIIWISKVNIYFLNSRGEKSLFNGPSTFTEHFKELKTVDKLFARNRIRETRPVCCTGFHVSFNKKWNHGRPMMSLVLCILQSPQRPSSTSFCGARDEINLYNVEREKICVSSSRIYGEPARNRNQQLGFQFFWFTSVTLGSPSW